MTDPHIEPLDAIPTTDIIVARVDGTLARMEALLTQALAPHRCSAADAAEEANKRIDALVKDRLEAPAAESAEEADKRIGALIRTQLAELDLRDRRKGLIIYGTICGTIGGFAGAALALLL